MEKTMPIKNGGWLIYLKEDGQKINVFKRQDCFEKSQELRKLPTSRSLFQKLLTIWGRFNNGI